MRTRIAKLESLSPATASSRCPRWGRVFGLAPLPRHEGTKRYQDTLEAPNGGLPGG